MRPYACTAGRGAHLPGALSAGGGGTAALLPGRGPGSASIRSSTLVWGSSGAAGPGMPIACGRAAATERVVLLDGSGTAVLPRGRGTERSVRRCVPRRLRAGPGPLPPARAGRRSEGRVMLLLLRRRARSCVHPGLTCSPLAL